MKSQFWKALLSLVLFLSIVSGRSEAQTLDETYDYLISSIKNFIFANETYLYRITYEITVLDRDIGQIEIFTKSRARDGNEPMDTWLTFSILKIESIELADSSNIKQRLWINTRSDQIERKTLSGNRYYKNQIAICGNNDPQTIEQAVRLRKALLHAKKLLDEKDPFR